MSYRGRAHSDRLYTMQAELRYLLCLLDPPIPWEVFKKCHREAGFKGKLYPALIKHSVFFQQAIKDFKVQVPAERGWGGGKRRDSGRPDLPASSAPASEISPPPVS